MLSARLRYATTEKQVPPSLPTSGDGGFTLEASSVPDRPPLGVIKNSYTNSQKIQLIIKLQHRLQLQHSISKETPLNEKIKYDNTLVD